MNPTFVGNLTRRPTEFEPDKAGAEAAEKKVQRWKQVQSQW